MATVLHSSNIPLGLPQMRWPIFFIVSHETKGLSIKLTFFVAAANKKLITEERRIILQTKKILAKNFTKPACRFYTVDKSNRKEVEYDNYIQS